MDTLENFAEKRDLIVSPLDGVLFCVEAKKGEILGAVEQEIKKLGYELLATGHRNGNEYKIVRARR